MDRNVDSSMQKLHQASSNLQGLLNSSSTMQGSLISMEKRFDALMETLATTSKTIAPLQSLSLSNKALAARINRAISPSFKLLQSFKLAESLQRHLLHRSSKLATKKTDDQRLKHLLKYVNCVNDLTSAITSITQECEPAIQKLQEAVEFLSRTKATDEYCMHRFRETLVTLKALYEAEVGAMRYEGLLDEALLKLQDEYEKMLLKLRHRNMGSEVAGEGKEMDGLDLGSEEEVEVLRRISETLARNDCLDICIDIFVKARYKRAAKVLMRLNPDYLRTYAPEEIDEMEWESLETAISLWIHHFEFAVKTVFVSEKKLCNQVLAGIMEGLLWVECFVKIADRIMAVFFRFSEGVARSSKEPQKLFKLLDMFDSLEKLKPQFAEIFEGNAGTDICSRFRELEKLLVHASCKVFWEFGLQIEGNQDGLLPPPKDGSVPKIVRYAVNYLKFLASDNYSASMARVLRTEQIWKAGILSRPDKDENLLREAISNVMEALQRNVEAKKSRYRDNVLPHIFSMNTYWYIYMRTRNTELGKILGEKWMKKKYKTVAEESAYLYQTQAWGPLVRILEPEEIDSMLKDSIGALARGKIEAFMEAMEDNSEKHRSYYSIPDDDLREQIKEATVNFVVPAYAGFLKSCPSLFSARSVPPPDSIRELLVRIFDGENTVSEGRGSVSNRKSTIRRREFKRQGTESSMEGSYDMKDSQQ